MDRRERIDDFDADLAVALDSCVRGLWTCLPCEITKVDMVKMTVEAQPTIRGHVVDKDGAWHSVDLPLLVDLPIVWPQGGGFILTFPIKPGDECIVKFADRAIDMWWQNGGIQEQIEFRHHDLSDGFAQVGIRSQPRVLNPPPDPDNVQLRSDDGDNSVTLAPDGTMTAEATKEIRLYAPKITMAGWRGQGPTSIAIDGTTEQTGDHIADSISQVHHVHDGVTPGGGITGEPVGE